MDNMPARMLYYITHFDNIPSILKWGILSHKLIEKIGLSFEAISDAGVVERRRGKITPDGRNLQEFANVYFNARNPMLYEIMCKRSLDDIAILGVGEDVLKIPNVFVSDGNATNSISQIFEPNLDLVTQIRKNVDKEFWSEVSGSKREIMAECLVPDVIPSSYIRTIYVSSYESAEKLKSEVQQDIPIIPNPNLFFKPETKLNYGLFSIVEGDMFFSRMQTLTVSVNVVGVMGKGLASRAKYQFPDVYVHYQDLCRKGVLKMGKPCLYKRGTSLDLELAEEPLTLLDYNSRTYFLLFPTKNHWRDNADIRGIAKGLEWLQKNYKKEGITSLAIPALGCGLGRLEWRDVAPILCSYLSQLDIPVMLYLPTEKRIPQHLLSTDFLFRQ